ncbi:TetR family transcriptional regulator C-terminal domain-containing protein [Streptomyces sp. CA-181903]|uniref:TetR family transcriptional regulator C-terminal domain-containing protein n=1 Tax=Streptomyces sp. CA-181903 TaxID=3240055 RepID=UPI003D8EF5A7
MTLLRGTVAATTGEGGPGCLMVHGALATGGASGAVRAEAAARRHASEDALRERFEQALRDGDLPAGTDTGDLARYVCLVWYGIAVQASSGATPDDQNRAVDIAMRAFPGR